MKSAFFEFHVATTGLFTARGNLQVTSHNIANAATPGYSRQYAMQRANIPIALRNGKGMVGTGSEVYGVGQIRDFYLDKKYWSERGTLGNYSAKKTQLDVIEAVFNDLQEGGLTGTFNDFFDKLQSLSENSGDATYRTNLIQSASSLISLVQLQANALRKQQQDINIEMKAVVDRISSIAQQIGSLNKQIKVIENDGSVACDLRDSRARLVDELSIYVNVDVMEKEMNDDYAAGKYPDDPSRSDKRFVVMINGYELVNHFTVSTLTCVPRIKPYEPRIPDTAEKGEAQNEMDAYGLYDVYFNNGKQFNLYSTTLKGELKGLVDVRDGNNGFTTISDVGGANPIAHNTSYKGIPHYMNRLNTLVRTFAMAVNEGLDRQGNEIPGLLGGHVKGTERENPYEPAGWYFFTKKQLDPSDPLDTEYRNVADGSYGDYSRMNVFNININPAIIEDPYKIAAALPRRPDEPSDESDNRMILALLKLKDTPHLFKEGKLSDYINAISTELGIDVKQAVKFESNYTDVTTAVNNQRISVSGVSTDEEVVNMIKYQQLYQAAAKLINIIDMIYDVTVNRLGNW